MRTAKRKPLVDEFRLALKPCRASHKVGGVVVHCGQLWRTFKTDGEYRYGTLKCLNGHKVTGKFARTVRPLPRKGVRP